MSLEFTIAGLNDLLRETFLTGRVILTEGIYDLPEHDREEIVSRVRQFSDFTEDNDPHDEHDFGAFNLDGVGRIFWKIDYFDVDCHGSSPDPANPELTNRVLTIMFAEEY